MRAGERRQREEQAIKAEESCSPTPLPRSPTDHRHPHINTKNIIGEGYPAVSGALSP
jgi:hypothetical protein